MRITLKLAAATMSALALVSAAGCTGEDGDNGKTPQTQLTPAQRLSAAKATLDAAPSVHLRLTSDSVPSGARGVVAAEGWAKHPPAFKGTFKVTLAGVQADAEIISVDGATYAKLPLTPAMTKINPADFGLPDPAVLFGSTDKGIATLLTATKDPVAGDRVRKGSEILTTIKGTLPGPAVVDLFLIGDRSGSFTVSYSLTEQQQLREVRLVGPFFGSGTTSTYTLTLDKYGEAVTITKP